MNEDEIRPEDAAAVSPDAEVATDSIYTDDGVVLESLLESTRQVIADGEAEAVPEDSARPA